MEKTKEIKFSHNYLKLPLNTKTAKLLYVLSLQLEKQTKEFLQYDTAFFNSKTKELDHYPLPKKGEYLLLLFFADCGAFFTTLRRKTPEKEKYYMKSIGEIFKIGFFEGV